MNKYSFVVLTAQREDFLRSLQDLGMVDVTAAGWEPSDDDLQLMQDIERHGEAVRHLGKLLATEGFRPGEPYDTGAEAFEKYWVARKETARLETEIAALRKLAADVRHWGSYDPEVLKRLAEQGVSIRFFTAYSADFGKKRAEWEQGRIIEEVNAEGGVSYFAVITSPRDDVHIDAQEVRLPAESLAEIESAIAGMTAEIGSWDKVFAEAAATLPEIEAEEANLRDRLDFKRAAASGEQTAEGSLVVMEAWAREKQQPEVDAMLESYPGVIYFRERPSMDDTVPVELHNNRFASPFEFIGDLYAKPRYGKMDLTRWFAPFFMLFFGMCLGDMGYGIIIFAGGIALTLAGRKESMKQIGRLTMWCGCAAIAVGFMMGSLFGVSLGDMKIFRPVRHIFIDFDTIFYIAIAIGVFQVLFAIALNIITTVRAFGVRNAFSAIGWFVALITCIVSFGLHYLKIDLFPPGSTVFWICLGAGLFMMLFLDKPGRNPLLNFGSGLWRLFNNLTGLLSDTLSYIRLFAIGLSGGVLAMVFNQIAFSVAPDVPVLGQFITLLILLVGHGLNLFMATLSAIVHPLRLTFVEFYSNAGFEAAERAFTPLKRSSKNDNIN